MLGKLHIRRISKSSRHKFYRECRHIKLQNPKRSVTKPYPSAFSCRRSG